MTLIPVIVCAKNEERAIGVTLEALVAACEHAEAESAFRYDLRVVLDDTTDGTAAVVARHARVMLLESRGGKVEAQRTGLEARPGGPTPPFAIFCDADVQPSKDALLALTLLLDTRPDLQVAMCPLRPLPPRRRSPLARALHTYNLRRGFSSSRTWFNGKLFAMRAWHVPTRAALASRVAALPSDPFYDFAAGVVIDDIFSLAPSCSRTGLGRSRRPVPASCSSARPRRGAGCTGTTAACVASSNVRTASFPRPPRRIVGTGAGRRTSSLRRHGANACIMHCSRSRFSPARRRTSPSARSFAT